MKMISLTIYKFESWKKIKINKIIKLLDKFFDIIMTFKKKKDKMNFVSIIMGSKSDYEIMKNCSDTFEKFNVKYEMIISSAHRSPERTKRLCKRSRRKRCCCIYSCCWNGCTFSWCISCNNKNQLLEFL